MKKIYTLVMSILGAAVMYAQTPVTFTVDIAGAGLTPDANGVHIAGNFADPNYDGSVVNPSYTNWSPSAMPMIDNGNGTFSITLDLLPEHYEFKFVNGNDWPFAEDAPNICQVELNGNDNRFIEVGTEPATYAVCYSACALCGTNAVLLRVDMSMVDADGDGITGEAGEDFDPANLHVAGNFADPNYDNIIENAAYANWDPGFISLNDMGNGVYGVLLQLSPATYDYKFVNGNSWGFEEGANGTCFVGGNRQVVVDQPNTLTDAFCFGTCTSCVMPTTVTFRVNMSNETVSPNGVHIAGSLQGWDPGAADWTMAPVGNNIYELVKEVQAGTYQFKFINGNNWSGVDNDNESVPAECNVGGNRSLEVTGTAMTVEYCYNQCTAECVVDPDAADMTFRVNMANQIALAAFNTASDTLWMISGATVPAWQDGRTAMTDVDGDQVYECTVNLAGPANVQYKFMAGTDVFAPTIEEGPGINTLCGLDNGVGGFNRVAIRAGVAQVLPVVCFDLCGDCSGCQDSTSCNYNPYALTAGGECLTVGSPCEDGLSKTSNETYDANCECVGTVAVNEVFVTENVSVYPNPTEGLLNINMITLSTQDVKVVVYNAMGQIVRTEKFNKLTSGNNNLTLNLESAETGIYMVEVMGAQLHHTFRVAVK